MAGDSQENNRQNKTVFNWFFKKKLHTITIFLLWAMEYRSKQIQTEEKAIGKASKAPKKWSLLIWEQPRFTRPIAYMALSPAITEKNRGRASANWAIWLLFPESLKLGVENDRDWEPLKLRHANDSTLGVAINFCWWGPRKIVGLGLCFELWNNPVSFHYLFCLS